MVVAIFGTTISPYLFFWQAAEEVEEEKAAGRHQLAERVGASRREIVLRRVDVSVGTFFSNVTFFFITLTTALTLHRNGITEPQTTAEVASALEPIAGAWAAHLYTAGLLGTGLLAIPTLAGSAAYALAELFGWKEGMDERPLAVPWFYGAFALSIALAIVMDLMQFSAVRAMFASAVINGVLAPFLLVGIVVVASDSRIMQGQPSSRLARVAVLVTTAAMFGAAVTMFVTMRE
jgi:Mn2+/Fe2+ NRAMP family transporter